LKDAAQSPPLRGGVAATTNKMVPFRSWSRRGGQLLCLSIMSFFFLAPLLAHHSTARYDLSKTLIIQGTVTEVIWQNPHVILVMNDTKGEEQAFEAPSPTYIVSSGWTKDSIKVGEKVTVKANPPKNGQLPMYLVTITLPNGKEYSPKNPERPQ
jgi:hypothetical protein